MAIDKTVDSSTLDAALQSVANAIRAKAAAQGSLSFPSDFVSTINAMTELHEIPVYNGEVS